jgi:transcriptional regulator with XRE-family HTH domain
MKQSKSDERLYNREALMMDVTEDLLVAMEDLNVNKTELSNMLGKSKSFITQTLSGSRNITLRTLADITYALGVKVTVNFELPNENICVGNDFSTDVEDVTTAPNQFLKLIPSSEPKVISIDADQAKYKV